MHTSNQDDCEAHDDPDHDAYWAENNVEDPGRPTNTPDNPPRPIGIPPALPTLAAGNPKAKPTIPRQFPAPEKRLTPRKDFSSVYIDAQSQVTQLEREKFEYMKASDKAARAAAAVVDMRQAKSSLVEKLVASAEASPVLPVRSVALKDVAQRLPAPPLPPPACPPRIRQSWDQMPSQNQQLFVDAVALAMDRGFHQLFVDIHADTLITNEAHNNVLFFFWHRKFILGYENMLRSLGRRFACVTLPFYDYIQNNLDYLLGKCTSLESCSPFLAGLGGSTNGSFSSTLLGGFAFPHFKCVGSAPVSHACEAPGTPRCMHCMPRGPWTRTHFNSTALSYSSIKRVLFQPDDDIYSVTMRVERSPHDTMHFLLAGAVANFYITTTDPVFYGHHATIDILHAIYHHCRVHPLKLTKEQAYNHPINFEPCVVNGTTVDATSTIRLRLPIDGVPTSVDEYAVTRPWFQHVPLTYGEIVDTTNLGVHSYRYNLTGLLGTLYSHCDHAGMNHTANMELQANSEDYEDDDQHVVMDVTDVDSLTFLAWRYDVLVQARAQGLDDADADDEMDKMVVMVYEHCLPGTHSEYPEDFKAMWKIQGGEPSKAMLDGVLSGATPIRIQGWAGLNQRYFGCSGEVEALVVS
ncbi:hypothetical protein DYB37_007926 [Aphanomyces astaci]|uniref:Tyrosinase copper-binding domain-containing protein n=1 Tax=Aphanomyces astaci TaxID=112090 RepID=A0A3R7ES38_APHAT|nr:hypothetical protein DYB37_007926 [Aphanomyces astaci]